MRIKYKLVLALSFLSLLWERLWNRLWAFISLLLAFAATAFLNIHAGLGAAEHVVLLAVFAVLGGAALIFTGTPFSFPSRAETERRIEETSALKHRPLETLRDAPAGNASEETAGLWQKHLSKASLEARKLAVYAPRPDVFLRDRYFLRHAAILFFMIGLGIAQKDAPSRLYQSLSPDIASLAGKQAATFDLWITPPEYTHSPAVFLARAGKKISAENSPVTVPEGSLLKLRMSGFRFEPRLLYAGQKYAPAEAAPGSFIFDMPIKNSGTLRLASLFRTLGNWQVISAPDAAPEIAVAQTAETPNAALKITYKAHDDHGISRISASIKTGDDLILFDIHSPSDGEAAHVEDLTAHPAAGASATLTLEAEDGMGHKTVSAPHPFVLPERSFTNAVARSLIGERKTLILSKNNVLTRHIVAANVAEIIDQPALYKNDIVVFLALSSAARRLMNDNDADALSARDLLWNTALRLEDGGFTLAQRELRDALQKMSSALKDKSLSKQQLQEIMGDVERKMQQYVASLATELRARLREGKNMPVLSHELARKFAKSIDIRQLLEQMKQLSQDNSREGLQKMAENLKNMIDNLSMKKFDQMHAGQMKAMQSLQDLEDIIHRQQSLFDKTNREKDRSAAKTLAEEQSALRQKLGEAAGKLQETAGAAPDNFAKAGQSMKLSAEALSRGSAKESSPHQKAALDELQKGIDDAVSKMASQMRENILSLGLPSMGGREEDSDPLGRGTGGGDVKIPDEKEKRRVQEIIEELRHRSNEPDRAKVEREYIDRLLDRF